MDLTPFDAIDPCGYPGLRVTGLRNLGVTAPIDEVSERLLSNLVLELGMPIDRKDGR
jgi:lipoyl(octanoyl) transferase